MINRKIQLTMLLGLFLFSTSKCGQFDPSQHAQEKAIDTLFTSGGQIIVTQLNEELTYLRTKNRALTPTEQATEELNKKQQILADKQVELAEEQKKLTAIQIQDAELDILSKKYQITRSLHENNKSKESDEFHERYKLKIQEINKDLPELPAKETSEVKKEDENNTTKNTPAKTGSISFFTKLATPFVFALTTASECTDFLAHHSFAHITDLDCFKETFIGTHARDINRLLVATTIIALSYGSYKLYNKYNSEDDEDIFDNDLD